MSVVQRLEMSEVEVPDEYDKNDEYEHDKDDDFLLD